MALHLFIFLLCTSLLRHAFHSHASTSWAKKITIPSLTSYLYFRAVQKQGNSKEWLALIRQMKNFKNHPTDFEYISLARTKPHSYLSVVSKRMLGNVVFEVGHITTERNLASISKKRNANGYQVN